MCAGVGEHGGREIGAWAILHYTYRREPTVSHARVTARSAEAAGSAQPPQRVAGCLLKGWYSQWQAARIVLSLRLTGPRLPC